MSCDVGEVTKSLENYIYCKFKMYFCECDIVVRMLIIINIKSTIPATYIFYVILFFM